MVQGEIESVRKGWRGRQIVCSTMFDQCSTMLRPRPHSWLPLQSCHPRSAAAPDGGHTDDGAFVRGRSTAHPLGFDAGGRTSQKAGLATIHAFTMRGCLACGMRSAPWRVAAILHWRRRQARRAHPGRATSVSQGRAAPHARPCAARFRFGRRRAGGLVFDLRPSARQRPRAWGRSRARRRVALAVHWQRTAAHGRQWGTQHAVPRAPRVTAHRLRRGDL